MGMVQVKPLATQITEFNVAHLGLIPIQHRLPESAKQGWVSRIGDEKNGAGISVQTTSKDGIPYGVAGDVFAGLVTASVAAREGGGTSVSLNFAELARLSLLSTRAEDYQNLRRSLDQLVSAKFQIWNSWRTPLHQIASERTFSLIQDVKVTRKEHLFAPEQTEATYTITLNSNILDSLDGALTLMTNTALMAQLKSPTARGLYRILEAWRRDPKDFTQTNDQIMLSARDLVEACRLLGTREEAAVLLRPLFHVKGPFAQLKQAGYLKSVDTIGRGWETQISISFAKSNNLLNTTALRLLYDYGVTGASATGLASTHSAEEIECGIWMVEEKKKKSKVHNEPGMLITMLKEGDLEFHVQRFRSKKRPVLPGVAVKKNAPEPSEPESSEEQDLERARGILGNLGVMQRITTAQQRDLGIALEEGRLSYDQVRQLLKTTKAKMNDTVTELTRGNANIAS